MAKYSQKFGKRRKYNSTRVTDDALSGDVKFGLVPIGGIWTLMSSTTGTYSHPGGGLIDEGLMLCDGVSVIPAGPMAGQTVPGLDNNVFLRGSSSSGIAPVNPAPLSNSKVIPSAALTPHSHNTSVGNTNNPHGHGATPNGGSNAPHTHRQYTIISTPFASFGVRHDWTASFGAQRYPQGINTGSSNAPHTHPAGNVPAVNAPHSHPVSISPAGSGSPANRLDVVPTFMTAVFAIRVS
jgi:hypothetical protein